MVVSRSEASARAFGTFAATKGWRHTTVAPLDVVESRADVVVTCTPATAPVLNGVRPGACVVALGADVPGKRELGDGVLRGDDVRLLVDSAVQCLEFGEAAYKPAGLAASELGARFRKPQEARDPKHTIVCDLTGVAVQDVAIATTVAAAVAAAPPPAA